LSETDSAPAAWQEPNRSGGAGRKRGVGKMNARPALAFRRRISYFASRNAPPVPPVYNFGFLV